MITHTLTNLDKLSLLRTIWSFRVVQTLMPKSSALDLFLNALCQLYAPDNYIEYGPFKGESAFFNTTLTTHGYLVDNFSQINCYKLYDTRHLIDHLLVDRNLRQLLHANMQLIGNTNYTIIDQDVRDRAVIDQDAGVIFWDLFNRNRDVEADSVLSMIQDRVSRSNKVIIIVDDAVHEHQDQENVKFNQLWKAHYDRTIRRHFAPFMITNNRVYLSNFQIDPGFNKMLALFLDLGYIQPQAPTQTSLLYGEPIYDSLINFASWDLLLNDQLWRDLAECLPK